MRLLALVLFALLLSGCAIRPQQSVSAVEIREVKPRYIEEEAFKRISEYFTGGEATGDRVVIRSQPDARTGYYFTLVLDSKVRRLPSGTVIVGEFHTPKALDVQTHRFELPARLPQTREIFLGLTGEDWTFGRSAVPSAWRFTIEDANGNTLGRKESYLWQL